MQLPMTSPPYFPHHPIEASKRRILAILVAVLLFVTPTAFAQAPGAKLTVYDFSLIDQTGKVVPLSWYKGKILLIVNLASQSAYSDQIAALNDLEKAYASQGLVVLGIPSADFGGEELKDPVALRTYYTKTVHADFPVFASATITGVHVIPLFQFLCDPRQSVPGGDLRWSYTKFLIDRDGKPLARYEVDVDPADADFHVAVESALDGKFKPHAPGEKPVAGADNEIPTRQ
jgi:glutathione peroxidase